MKRLFFIAGWLLSTALLMAEVHYTLDDHTLALTFSAHFPDQYFSFLSADKLQLTIVMPNVQLKPSQHYLRHPVFKEFLVLNRHDTAFIHIFFRKATGYALAPLPYSRTLGIEIFHWKDLSQAQVFYYSGLLALESRLWSEAQRYCEAAGKLGEPRGYAYAGFAALQQGKFAEALLNFAAAVRARVAVPDVMVALADLALYYQRPDLAETFRQQYRSRYKQQAVPTLLFTLLDTLSLQPGQLSLAAQLAQRFTLPLLDSVARWIREQPSVHQAEEKQPVVASSAKMKGKRKGSGIAGESRKRQTTSPASAPLPSLPWSLYLLSGVAIALLIAAGLLLFFYFRWRRQRQVKDAFQQMLQLAEQMEIAEAVQRKEPGGASETAEDSLKSQQPAAESEAQNKQKKEGDVDVRRGETIEDTDDQPVSEAASKAASKVASKAASEAEKPSAHHTHLDALLQELDQQERVRAKAPSVPIPSEIAAAVPDNGTMNSYQEATTARKLGVPRSLLRWYRSLTKTEQPATTEEEK